MAHVNQEKKLVVGIGSALVDILTHGDEEFLKKAGAPKGGMALVNHDVIEKTLSENKNQSWIVPGGSACNTMIGIGKLGGAARFVGKLGQDDFGMLFRSGLENNNVEPALFHSTSPTGRVLSIITPDAQRSMLTYLGAASETVPEEITDTCFTNAAIVHVEGYLIYNKDVILTALKKAKTAGAKVSLDLSSFNVVEQSKAFIESIVKEYVDILIANEDEARVFTGHTDELNAIRSLSEKAEIAVLKIGKRGSYISHHKEIIHIKPVGDGSAIDTTGAGDLWASGFLYGLVNGYPLQKCGEIGSACGYEVCQVIGATIPEEGWTRIRNMVFNNNF